MKPPSAPRANPTSQLTSIPSAFSLSAGLQYGMAVSDDTTRVAASPRRATGGRRRALAVWLSMRLARILHYSSRCEPILWEVRAPVELELSQDLSQVQSARVSARLVAANYIL